MSAEEPAIESVDTGGRYRVIRLLGRGGMGTVYLARQTALDRDVALKVISVQEAGLPEDAVLRFEQEMRATARVEHPNTVRLYDSGAAGRGLYLAMEYLPGSTLREVLDTEGRLPPTRVVHIAKQVARALTAAHRQRIVHRDLKPENIMLLDQFGEPDFVKVLDFGIARFLDAQTAPLTARGAVIGTPAYMSPEQAQGRVVDELTDLYSLGVILYEMLCGRPPLVRDTALSTLLAQVNEQPVPVPSLAPDTPAELAALVMALLQKSPDARPASAETVATALAQMEVAPQPKRSSARVETVRLPSSEGEPVRGDTAVLSPLGGTVLLPDEAVQQQQAPRPEPSADSPPHVAPPLTVSRSGRPKRAILLVAALMAVAAVATNVARRAVRARDFKELGDRLDQLARDRHEPRPRGCPPCSLADLRGLVTAQQPKAAPETALRSLETVAESCEDRWTAAARLRLAVGDIAGAAGDAARGVAVCPTDALAHHLLGNAAMKAGEADQARVRWNEAAALDGSFAAPRFNLALDALAHRDPAAAIRFLDQAIAEDPGAPHAHLLRGRARLAAEDRVGAAADLTEAVRRAPDDPDAWKWLGLALNGRDAAAARQAFCRAHELGSTDPAVKCPP